MPDAVLNWRVTHRAKASAHIEAGWFVQKRNPQTKRAVNSRGAL